MRGGQGPCAHGRDEGLQSVGVRALQDAAQSHDGSVPVLPVGTAQMLFDEGCHVCHNVVLAAGGHQREADTGRLARVPVVLIVVLLLEPREGGRHQLRPTRARGATPTCLARESSSMGTR